MGFAADDPFYHLAVWFAGVVDEAGDGAAGGVDDHVLVEEHEVVALLPLVSVFSKVVVAEGNWKGKGPVG